MTEKAIFNRTTYFLKKYQKRNKAHFPYLIVFIAELPL